jgi:hypothetical protein
MVTLSELYPGGGTQPNIFAVNLIGDVASSSVYAFTGSHNGLRFGMESQSIQEMTFGVWLWVDALLANEQTILSKSSYFAVSQTDFPLSFNVITSGELELRLDSGNNFVADTILQSVSTISTNTWIHVGISYKAGSGGSAGIYINGTLDSSVSISHSMSTGSQKIALGIVSLLNSTSDNRRLIGKMFNPFLSFVRDDSLIGKYYNVTPPSV